MKFQRDPKSELPVTTRGINVFGSDSPWQDKGPRPHFGLDLDTRPRWPDEGIRFEEGRPKAEIIGKPTLWQHLRYWIKHL